MMKPIRLQILNRFTGAVLALAVVLAPVGIVQAADADAVTVLNAGFEDPDNAEGEFIDGDIPSWTLGSYEAGDPEWFPVGEGGGNWDPDESDGFTGGAAFAEKHTGWAVSGAETDVGLSQVLDEKLQANTKYVLSAQIGNAFYNQSDVTAPFRIELLAGDVLLGSATGESPVADTWEQQSLTYTSSGSHEQIGEALEIRLIAVAYADDNGEDGYEVDFDEVTLTAEPVTGLEVVGVAVKTLNDSTVVELQWRSLSGASYSIDFSDDFVRWIEADDGIEADGALTTIQLDAPTDKARYYRVREQ